MRVLHVIPSLAPRYGGPSAVLPNMCRALGEQGVETAIATTDADGGGRLDVALNEETRYQGTATIFFRRQFSESLKYSRPLACWLRQNVRFFDVVHVHAVLSHACLAAGHASRAARVPYVVRPLGTLDPWSLGQKALKKRVLLWAAGRRLLVNAAAIHYTSRCERRLVEASLGLTRGTVIPLGAELTMRASRRESAVLGSSDVDDSPYVLSLGRLHPVKGLETLIASFAEAVVHDKRWRLVVAGEGDAQYARSLRRVAEQHGVNHRVDFPGWVDGPDKYSLIQNASLFAVPSLHENFGVALVEALGCGVPAVVSSEVHLSDDIQEAGAGWVTGADARAFGATLGEAMQSGEERKHRGEAAAQLARRFEWPHVARELVELYGRLAQSREASGVRAASASQASGSSH